MKKNTVAEVSPLETTLYLKEEKIPLTVYKIGEEEYAPFGSLDKGRYGRLDMPSFFVAEK